jgi:tetratricopeptide (TPR) repeat protein
LVVFASDFSRDAVQPLVTEFGNEEEIGSGLQALVDKGLLLEVGEPPTGPRYKLLERVRKYALGSLVKPKELKNAQRIHASYYLALAEEADSHLWGPGEAEAVKWLEREHQNLRVALRWLIDNKDTENALRLVGALCLFWEILGFFHEGRKWFNAVLEQARTGNVDERVLAKALSGGGMLAHGQGDHEEATRLIDEAIALRRKLGDQYDLCLSLNDMALVKLFTMDFDAANAFAIESLELGRGHDYRGIVAAALRRLGLVERERGDIDSAREHFTESLEIYRQLGDVWRTAIALDNLAGLELDVSNVTTAEPLLTESKDLKETIGDIRGAAFAHKNLARLRLYQGNYEAALRHALTSRSIWIRIGDNRREAETLVIMGWAHCYIAEYLRANNSLDAERHYKSAKKMFTSSLTNMRTPQNQRNVAESIEGLARVFAQYGEAEMAAILCGAASQLRNQTRVPGPAWQVAELHRTEAYVRDQLGDKTWTAVRARGQSMQLDAVLELALLAEQQPARL